MEIAPDIVAEHAGQAQEGQQHAVDEHGLLAADAEGVHADGQNVLKHRQHRGEAGEHHEQEEQRAPEAAAGHVHEQRRQGLKDQRGAFTRRNAEGEAGRENDGARHEGHEGIQNTDADSLAGEGLLVAHVTAEDLHGADAQRQGEERLIHGVGDEAAEAVLPDGVHGGQQVELHALRRAGESQAVDRQHHDQCQQADHHDLGHPLQTLLKAEAAHDQAGDHHQLREDGHGAGAAQHGAEHPGDLVAGHAGVEAAGEEFSEIVHHPAGDGGVIHHQQIAARQTEPAVDVPLGAGLFQILVGQHGALAAAAAHRQFHGHHGDAQQQQAHQIEQDEVAAAVLAGDIGEAPHVADADGAARAHQQEAQPGAEGFSLHF